MEQACKEPGVRVAKLEACVENFEKRLEQSASRVRGAGFNYLRSYNESQTLKRRLATRVSCNGKMEQQLIIASMDVLGNLYVLFSKTVRSQTTIRESFCGSFVSFYERLQTLFTQKIAGGSNSVDAFGRNALFELRGSISKCMAATKSRLDRLTGGLVASSRSSVTDAEAGGTGKAKGVGQLK